MAHREKGELQMKRGLHKFAALILLSVLMVNMTGGMLSAEAKTVDVIPGRYRLSEEQMAIADQWQGMDESMLRKVMDKAAAGRRVTIAVLGGSITRGKISNGSSDDEIKEHLSYAQYFQKWWEKSFPKAEIRFVNAGIGSTDSYLGIHRVRKDVLEEKPDLVLVEFAVNDMKTDWFECVYENLVRRLLEAEKRPAVLLLFTATISGFSCQKRQARVGMHYGLPMLSYRDVMKDLIREKTYTQKQLSGDRVHPSALGHAVIGEILQRYLNEIRQKPQSEITRVAPTSSYLTQKKYKNASILDSTTLNVTSLGSFERSKVLRRYCNDFTCKRGSGNMSFTVRCKNLGLMYLAQTDGKGGQFNVYVDGKWVAKVDADYSSGTHIYCKTQECFSSDRVKNHTVRIIKSGVSTGSELTVLGVLVSD